MGGNIAGIYGAQIFRQDDRPLYQRGFAVNISILVAGLLLAVVRFVDDLLRRRRKAAQLQLQATDTDNGLSDEKADRPDDVQPAPISTKDGVLPAGV
jgi:hypothetical protein